MVEHQAENGLVDKAKFRPKMVLRTNLMALLRTNHGPNTQGQLKKKSGVAQSTIGRILSKEGENARIETLDALAKAYGLEGWQMLVAGMDPENPPVLQPLSKEERGLYERLKSIAKDIKA